MKIVVDMMGGDLGTTITVSVLKEFSKNHVEDTFYCVGKKEELKELEGIKNIVIVEASDVLKMDVNPLDAMKDKNSSMYIGYDTYLKEQCDGILSCGSTGAFLTLATLKLKRIEGITRPGLITPFPTKIKGKNFLALDLGANATNTSEELYQFGKMGSIMYELIYGVKSPKVALLNIGSEEDKGDEIHKEAYQFLKNDKSINFIGNVEGREPLYNVCDVLVTDGFSGNIFLKTMEGSMKIMTGFIKESFKRNLFSKIGYLLSSKGFKEIKERMNYKNVGGAMLIGVNGVAIKAHGNSDNLAFTKALEMCYNLAKKDIVKRIKEGL